MDSMDNRNSDSAPLVSVIVPTFNSRRTIAECLQSLMRQTYRNTEVVVVDRYSTDGTQDLVSSLQSESPIPIRFFESEAERAEAKNTGIRFAHGKFLLFLDSDMRLAPSVISECVRKAETNADVGAVSIPERSVGESIWVRARDFERSFYKDTPVESARFFRRRLVEESGGFEPGLVFFEESSLPLRITKMAVTSTERISVPILHDESNFSLLGWLRKKYYYGKTASQYVKRGGKRAVLSPTYRLGIFLTSKRFLKGGRIAVAVLALKSMEFFCMLAGSLVASLTPTERHRGVSNSKAEVPR